MIYASAITHACVAHAALQCIMRVVRICQKIHLRRISSASSASRFVIPQITLY